MGWNELPVEIMEIIFSQVHQPDLPSLRFVSRATNHAICPLIWKRKLLCVEWKELPYLEEIMGSDSLSYPLSQLVTGLKVRTVPTRIPVVPQTQPTSFSGTKAEATRRHKTLSMLLAKNSDKKTDSLLEEQAEWSITDAGLDIFYRIVRKFANLKTLGVPSLDTLVAASSSSLETFAIARSTLQSFQNIEELRLNSVWLNRREGKVTPGDLIRCLVDFPHLKTLSAHVQTDQNVHPLVYTPTKINCALRHLELTIAKNNGRIMDSLIQFLRLTKDLHMFLLDDRTTRKTMGELSNSFVWELGGSAPELDIPRIVEALYGSHETLVRLNITQYDPFLQGNRDPVLISFRQFTSLETLVIPFTPVLPASPQNVQSHTICFPKSLAVLTIVREAKLSLHELEVILHLLRNSLRELGAFVIGNYQEVQDTVYKRSPGKVTWTTGDKFQGAQWVNVHISRPEVSKDRV
ncbi:12359_t:CDS:1 [Acaulospora colombiana]|uniref:12359_t:CDS:1 n=1 Tax=Acaulospora colombiana TaxID=27376 RepID=A0ACA9MTC4_9GLOM|nr:12359_t:CDS:1 [Acaulospora colombiana]